MYNIHNHYRNILSFVSNIIAEPTLLYLYPFGSTSIENLEVLKINRQRGPIILCYDQEPLITGFNNSMFEYVNEISRWMPKLSNFDFSDHNPVILLNTELDSDDKNQILKEFNFIDCYCFFHVFAAADWFRGYQFDAAILPPRKRTIKKKFITFNRLTSNARIYRSLWINELIKHNVLDHGHVSFSKDCPDGGNFAQQLRDNSTIYKVPNSIVEDTITNISLLKNELRIDTGDGPIPNGSFELNAVSASQESFAYVVTETCFWGRKKHLTEKVFKPIVEKIPFLLLAPAHNLAYLKSYGVKTFSEFWDESYDQEEDDLKRLQMVGDILKEICSYSDEKLQDILKQMEPILEHNHQLFFSGELVNRAWAELTNNLRMALGKCPDPMLDFTQLVELQTDEERDLMIQRHYHRYKFNPNYKPIVSPTYN